MVVKGEKIGTVVYIGKLDFDIMGQIYIGVHLDMPGKITHGECTDSSNNVDYSIKSMLS